MKPSAPRLAHGKRSITTGSEEVTIRYLNFPLSHPREGPRGVCSIRGPSTEAESGRDPPESTEHEAGGAGLWALLRVAAEGCPRRPAPGPPPARGPECHLPWAIRALVPLCLSPES